MQKLIIIACACLFALSANAQEGYIITNGLDTVYGKIKPGTPAHQSVRITFIDQETGERKVYKPFEIKSWHVTSFNTTFESKGYKVGKRRYGVFMKLLNHDGGQVSCYEYWNTDGQTGYTQVFLEKDGEMTTVRYGKFYKQLAEYFGDAEELKQKIEQKEYKKKELVDIVIAYNKWLEYKWDD